MRVIIIEDNLISANAIATIFKNVNHVCDVANSAEDGLQLLKCNDYDVLILDMMLPKISGEGVIQKLRAGSNKIAIIVLSALDNVDKKCECLNLGADEFISKPVSSKELIARVQAVVRRKMGYSQSKITAGPLSLYLDTKLAKIDDVVLPLTSREYAVLELLMLKKGHVLEKEIFLNHIYDTNMQEPSVKIVDVFICKLRKKMDVYLGCRQNPIQTAWGRGYIIASDAEAGFQEYQKN